MNRLFIFCILAVCLSCSSKVSTRDENIEIVIEYTFSYKYDLKNEIYTTFYLSKSPSTVKFKLTNKEKKK